MPGRNSWCCPHCSKQLPWKNEPCGGLYNGATATSCRQCGKPANKSCNLWGTNGKDGGKWKPWNPDKPPSSSPTSRSPAQTAANEKRKMDNLRKEKELAEKRLQESKLREQKLRDAAKQPGGATAAPPAAAAANTSVASGTNQAATAPEGAAVKAEMDELEARVRKWDGFLKSGGSDPVATSCPEGGAPSCPLL